MIKAKAKGYRSENKVRHLLERKGWKVLRAGSSLGDADLICIRKGKCIMLQIKSTNKKKLYYYGYMKDTYEGFPFLLVVDFGYGNIRIMKPTNAVKDNTGTPIEDYLNVNEFPVEAVE